MSPKGPDPKPNKDAAIVDHLLKDLFFGETGSKGQSAKHPATPKKKPRLSGSGPRPMRPSAAVASVPQRTGNQRVGTWGRISLGLVMAVGMLQWPYAHSCGFKLGLYLTAVAMVLVTAAWASAFSWKNRMPLAHSVSQVLLLWGLVLVVGQVLPRVGYAQDQATWRCIATPVTTPSTIAPVVSPETDAVIEAVISPEEIFPAVPDTSS